MGRRGGGAKTGAGAKGRGGAAQWAAQWWAAATDAATVVAETFDGDQKFTSAVQHSTESPVVGVYARGSVARGEARAGVSDVDLVTVCWGHDTADDVRDMARLKRRLNLRLNSKPRLKLRARLDSTGGSVRATGGGSSGTPDASSRGENSGEEDSWLGRWGHLATKADVRVVTVPPPPHPAGVALAAAIAGEPMARQPPDAVEALAQCLGDETMFVLAVECAPITGPDLPALLPASAGIPPPARCLETLNADVVDALADGGERALTWALKRCVRAAFERETSSTRRTRQISGDVAGANADGRGAIGRVYTRDLYYCAGLASDARPELGEDLAAALCASVHGPRAVWGALWYACGSALCVRLRDAIAYGEVGPR
uniref:Polymerase nucleotidyl transferase domain-containing protein n=1 Tax=Micromonas pusilla TaxID=38833 RepID=A0A7S0IHL4_MICPS